MADNKDFLEDVDLIDKVDLKPFFEKVKILSKLEKAVMKANCFEQDIAFIEALKPLLSSKLQVKAEEAKKMLPFFSIMPLLKNKKD